LPDGAGSDCFVRVDAPFVRLVRVVRVLFAIAVSQISTGKQFTSSQAGVSSEQTRRAFAPTPRGLNAPLNEP